MKIFDAVIIGAGHNGLVAANLLADAGWSVVVIETAAMPGGTVRSAELAAPGYLTDTCAAFFPFAVCSPVLRRFGLAEYGLRWSHAPTVLTHLLTDGTAVTLARNPQDTARSVERFAPGDGHRWLKTYEQWRQNAANILYALFAPFPPIAGLASLGWALPVPQLLRTARRALLPVRQLGRELFNGRGAQALLAGCALHTDLGPDDAASGTFGWLLVMLGQQVGFPTVAGGAGRLTDALVSRLKARGGKLRCEMPVVEVVVNGNSAVGVRTADGTLVKARHAVLADVSAPMLYTQLLNPQYIPAQLLADMDHFSWDHATIKVDWATDGPIPWAAQEAVHSGVIHLGMDVTGLATYANELANGQIPRKPFLVVGQMTTADPSRSAANTQTLWAYTHVPNTTLSPGALNEHVARMEAELERHAPGFQQRIRARAVHTPEDMHNSNPSLLGGAINGGTSAIHQQLIFRPILGLGRADTVVDRLYLASASTHPSGGVHGGPGANAARAALARAKPLTGWLYRTAIQSAYSIIY